MENWVNAIKADLFRLYPGPFTIGRLFKGFRSKGFKFLFFLRIASLSNNPFLIFSARGVLYLIMYRYGFQIPRKTRIGPGFFIGHFGTIVISRNAVIGKNCNIAHNVTIGSARGKRSGAPTLGDAVWIGAGAVIVGRITIGSDVLIAPNAFVNFDVPSNSVVIGNPARIISKIDATHEYIHNRL